MPFELGLGAALRPMAEAADDDESLISSMLRSAVLTVGLLLGAAPTGNLAIDARLSGGGWDSAIGTELEVLPTQPLAFPVGARCH